MRWFGSKGDQEAAEPAKAREPKENSHCAAARPRCRRTLFFWLHIVLLGCVVVGLAFLNQAWGLDRLLNSRWPTMRASWLPFLFLLSYLLCWLSMWAVRQLGPDRLTGEFPDLDRAWADARRLVADAGIDLRTTPLFLVVGQPEDGIELFFAASHWPFQVRFAGEGTEPAIHLYGNREAIFISCSSNSLLTAATRRPERGDDAASVPSLSSTDASQEVVSSSAAVGDSLAVCDTNGSSPTVAAVSTFLMPRACLIGEEPSVGPRRAVTPWPTQDRDLVEHLHARLRALCRLIAHDRQPLVPINGVLALFPLNTTDSSERARIAAQACRADLQQIRQSLGTECPHVAVLCDCQGMPGFESLVSAFPDGSTQQWVLGRTFPLVPDIDPARWPSMLEQGLRWLADSLWPSAVYRLMRPGDADWQTGDPHMQSNQECFRLLEDGWRRLQRIPAILVAGFQTAAPIRPLFGGFALAATGADNQRQQAFVAGVLRWLVESQDCVAWTDEALQEDRICRRWSTLGSLGLTGALALLAALSIGLLR